MADQADVLVKNVFGAKTINVKRKLLVDNSTDYETTVTENNQEQIALMGPETSMVIDAPEGVDLKDCQIKLGSAIDMEVIISRTNSQWTFRILENDLPPEVPVSLNVSIGDVEPE